MTQLKTASHLVVVLHLTMERHKAKKWEVQTSQQKNVLHKMKTLKNKMYSALISCHQVLDALLHKAVTGFPGGKVGEQICGGHQPKKL